MPRIPLITESGDLTSAQRRVVEGILGRRGGRIPGPYRFGLHCPEVTEAWQECGRDFVTVLLAGSLIDYTVDAAGAVVAGSRTGPERFEEFWTFTRPVGPNTWVLTAIQTG